MINIILIDDQVIFGEGIANLLAVAPKYNFMGYFSGIINFESFLEKNKIDIILLDMSIGSINGFEYCQQVKKRFPEINILFFTMCSDELIIERAMKAESTKNNTGDILFKGINRVNLEEHISLNMAEILKKDYIHEELRTLPVLSLREKEVLNLIVMGQNIHEIALKLDISYQTVAFHQSNLFIKFDAHNVVDLAREAIRIGIIDLKTL